MNYKRELRNFEGYLQNRVQPGTLNAYIYALGRWFGYLDGYEPTSEAAQRYVDLLAKTKSASTANLRAHAIMRWFKWKGTAIDLDCPTIRINEPEYLTMNQFEQLLAVCTNLLEKVLLTVLFDTALRINELLSIELDDIDWSLGVISVTGKGGRKEGVNISEKGLASLEEWLTARHSDSKKVFMGLSYWDAWNMIKAIGKRVGIEIHPHMLRHSRAVQMLKANVRPHIVQQHLRHKNIATTMNIYGKFTVADLREEIPAW